MTNPSGGEAVSSDMIKKRTYDIQQEVLKIQTKTLEKLSKLIVEYYNFIKNKKAILLESSKKKREEDWQQTDEDAEILAAYEKLQQDIIDLLMLMLEQIYELTSSTIRELYGEDKDYPPSRIKFFDKDGKNIIDRLNRWFNPYSIDDKGIFSLNNDFRKDKLKAISKMDQISKAEALNEMEIIKFDKLFGNCDHFTIENEDEEDDCYDIPGCEIYWKQIWHPNHDGTSPIPIPLYHPDCECYAVYYLAPITIIDDREEKLEEIEDEELIEPT